MKKDNNRKICYFSKLKFPFLVLLFLHSEITSLKAMDSEIYKKQEKNALAGSKQQERWCKWCEEWSDLYEEVLDDIVQTEGENKGNEPRKDYFKMQNYFNFDKTTFKLDFGKNANKLNHISNLKIFKDFKISPFLPIEQKFFFRLAMYEVYLENPKKFNFKKAKEDLIKHHEHSKYLWEDITKTEEVEYLRIKGSLSNFLAGDIFFLSLKYKTKENKIKKNPKEKTKQQH